jgi:hypothetical protein
MYISEEAQAPSIPLRPREHLKCPPFGIGGFSQCWSFFRMQCIAEGMDRAAGMPINMILACLYVHASRIRE